MARTSSLKSCLGMLALASLGMVASRTAQADATLDRIKGRQKFTVGIILSGAPFGYIDPQSRAEKGFNIDLAKALAEKLGVKVELVTVTPRFSASALARSMLKPFSARLCGSM